MVTRSVEADAVERRFLVQEHREIAHGLACVPELAGQLGRLPSADLAWMLGGVIRWLETSLAPHAAWEEAWLYPRLEQLTGSPWPGRLLSFHHDQIRERIEALKAEHDRLAQGTAVAPTHELPAMLFGLEALIRAHLECEDRYLLPVLDEPVRSVPGTVG
jgi:hemerythrin-like domain-containing protein